MPLHSTPHRIHGIMCIVTVHDTWYTHSVHFVHGTSHFIYGIVYTLHTIHHKWYTVLCTVCTRYTIHYTRYYVLFVHSTPERMYLVSCFLYCAWQMMHSTILFLQNTTNDKQKICTVYSTRQRIQAYLPKRYSYLLQRGYIFQCYIYSTVHFTLYLY